MQQLFTVGQQNGFAFAWAPEPVKKVMGPAQPTVSAPGHPPVQRNQRDQTWDRIARRAGLEKIKSTTNDQTNRTTHVYEGVDQAGMNIV
ncbi:hypothetical protein, partial [Streptomyces galilaeus]|uniref:hypothetical protein n=1 Tax=Streptomyces galilaeus TaxID=33899 RepID=UPI0038F8007F